MSCLSLNEQHTRSRFHPSDSQGIDELSKASQPRWKYVSKSDHVAYVKENHLTSIKLTV